MSIERGGGDLRTQTVVELSSAHKYNTIIAWDYWVGFQLENRVEGTKKIDWRKGDRPIERKKAALRRFSAEWNQKARPKRGHIDAIKWGSTERGREKQRKKYKM